LRYPIERYVVSILLCMILWSVASVSSVAAWGNGGFSSNPSSPDYGTHDWIAHHALDWMPKEEKQYILDNLNLYLYGTELPDNSQAKDGIGDTGKHHVYYDESQVMIDDSSAVRASASYSEALESLKAGGLADAAKYAGVMSHYIVDLASFGHVMGAGTPWGAEHHHSDYEEYVSKRTSNYESEFNSYLIFDRELGTISAYDAAKNLAYDTTFDFDGDLTCLWMDQNYNWNKSTFKNRCGESLNLAVNYLADVLHTLYVQALTQELTFKAQIKTVDLPAEVELEKPFTVIISIQYVFSLPTTVRVGVWDYTASFYVASREETLSGKGLKIYILNVSAPSAQMSWHLRADVHYLKEGIWQHDPLGWYQEMSTSVIPEFTLNVTTALAFILTAVAVIASQRTRFRACSSGSTASSV